MVELSNVEKLIVKQAFVNAVADDIKTKDPDNLRGKLDALMEENYYSNPLAGKSFDLMLMGQKVGTYSLTISKGKPQQVETVLEVNDNEKLAGWAAEHGFLKVDMDAVNKHFSETGEVPDGCEPDEYIVPEVMGGKVTRSTIKVNAQEVLRVLGPQLEAVAYALLEGEGDE